MWRKLGDQERAGEYRSMNERALKEAEGYRESMALRSEKIAEAEQTVSDLDWKILEVVG
jgi:hypothetical protein